MNCEFEAAATEFLKSDEGRKVKDFAASPAGKKLRDQYSQSGEKLREAVQRGDMASAEAMLKNFLQSSEGQKLAQQLQDMMG